MNFRRLTGMHMSFPRHRLRALARHVTAVYVCPMRLLPLLLLLLLGCAGAPSPSAIETKRMKPDPKGVDAVLDDFHAAASEADGPRYFGHFTPDGVFIGTDATERWDVGAFKAYAEPHFSKGKGWTYTPIRRNVMFGADGRTAWFDEQLRNEKYGVTRGSGALVLLEGRWRIAHYVLSFPIPNDKAKAVLAITNGE